MRILSVVVVVVFLALPACGTDGPSSPDASSRTHDARGPDAETSPPTEFGGDRPAILEVPSSYDGSSPTPFVLALHGYFASPDYVLPYLKIADWAEEHGVLLLHPDGLVDPEDNYYWNATDACCDKYDAAPDDVGYLTGLIEDVSAEYNVDPARVYVIGHSNGGFMAHRLACERPDLVAAIVSHAGAIFADEAACSPSEPVSVLQLHGADDTTILYEGGTIAQANDEEVAYPGAATTVGYWAADDGCDASTEAGADVDLTTAEGAETSVVRHTGCPAGIDVELWTAPGGGHVLVFGETAPDVLWQWLEAHPKPQ